MRDACVFMLWSIGPVMLLAWPLQIHPSRSLCSPSSASTVIVFMLAVFIDEQGPPLQPWYWLMPGQDMNTRNALCRHS